jgi:diguanylate cyclase (GGDEF)-like protein/PAS domain S-box-containing protein
VKLASSPNQTRFDGFASGSAAFAEVALERSPFGMSLTSTRPESFGAYLFANPAYCRITGLSLDQLRTVTFRDVVHPDDYPSALEGLRKLMSGEVAEIDTEVRLRRSDGTNITVRQHRTAVEDAAGQPLWTLTHTEDVTERKASDAAIHAARTIAEDALRESESRYRLLADHVADMIVCTRRDRTRSYVSPASQQLLGYSPAELMETDFATFLHADDLAAVQSNYALFLERGGSETHTYRLRRRDGTYVWVEAHWVKMPATTRSDADGSDAQVVSIVRDISERKAAEHEIEFMGRHDVLTGLANRALLRERLDEARALVDEGGSMALLSVDLDNFKGVNDTLGHAAGDALLKAVADRLLRCVRQGDTVARLGGDEFIILLPGFENRHDAAQRAQSIVDVLSAPYEVAGHEILISASVGVTTSPHDGILTDQLLKNADVALYSAKADGRRTYRLFEPAMAARRQSRLDMEGELRAALSDGNFTTFYQPIVCTESGELSGFEALVRWQHPVRGLISPDKFIPVAEDTGMIVPLGEWVLRGACLEASHWPAGVRVCVNVSPIQFRSPQFVDMVRSALAEAGLAAERLDLEITESVLLKENDGTLAVLSALRGLGVTISLDDFGTGYSSLGYLRSFRFDRIKIDRSFVGDLLHRPESEAIVRAAVGIGAALGISCVAEGVETYGQLQRLRGFGCSEAQGFLFSKPRPADEIAAMLAVFPTRGAGSRLLVSANREAEARA